MIRPKRLFAVKTSSEDQKTHSRTREDYTRPLYNYCTRLLSAFKIDNSRLVCDLRNRIVWCLSILMDLSRSLLRTWLGVSEGANK